MKILILCAAHALVNFCVNNSPMKFLLAKKIVRF